MCKDLKKQKKTIAKDGIVILYGTKTGNAKVVAKELKKQLKKMDLDPITLDMKKTDPEILYKISKAYFIVSTHNEGEPPSSARKFFKQLHSSKMNSLDHLEFSVCGLGDSSYDMFCEASKILNQQLCNLGAKPVLERVECDLDFGSKAAQWIKNIIQQFENKTEINKSEDIISFESNEADIYEGKLTACEKLSKSENGNNTYHIELSDFNKPFDFYPGDLIEIVPNNPQWLVEELALKLKTTQYNEVLFNQKEICRLTPAFVKFYAMLTNNQDLNQLISDISKFKAFVEKANLLDLLTDFQTDLEADKIIDILPGITGRQYSIANYATKSSKNLHLMIKTIRYQYKERKHEGAASVYTNEYLKIGQTIRFRYIKNTEYHLPKKQKSPLILIGTGTGYAPLRGYLQQWHNQKTSSKAWVIWGEQLHQFSNRYNAELEALQKQTKLLQVDCVSSRDDGRKTYVQDAIKSNPKQFRKLIDKGASVYICGSKQMGNDVENTINEILKNNNTSLEKLKESNRYIASVY